MTTRLTALFAAALVSCLAMQTSGASPLRSGASAVTLWWVIFNEPDHCTANPGGAVRCGGVDVFGAPFLESVANGTPNPALIAPNLDAGLAVVYATGGVTSGNGRVRLVASIYRNEPGIPKTLTPAADPMGIGRALDSEDAEIHLVVRDHGRPNYGDLLPQITSFLDPYCSDPNLLWFAGKNVCADVQFAVFGPGQSGDTTVQSFAAPGEPLPKTRATLMRDGDVVRAVVDTRLPVAR